jgi:RNA polymerase sigma-70 factor (ECF subfamily)
MDRSHSFDSLLSRDRGRLRRLLMLHAGPGLLRRWDVEDLVQEACAEALGRIGTYRDRGHDSFFRWLATIALNRMRNLRRIDQAERRDARRERRFGGPETVARGHGVPDTPAPSPGPCTLTASAEAVDRFEAALTALPPQDREVIRLARVDGLPLGEVAARLGRTRNATALLLSRALRKLKVRLAPRTSPDTIRALPT